MKVPFLLSMAALSFALAACSSGTKDKVAVAPDSAIGNWQVVTTQKTHNDGLCYAVSAPVRSMGTFGGKRGMPYLMATRRASGKIEVSVSSGYPYRQGGSVELDTGKKTFALKAKDSVAWAQKDKQDKAIVAALRKTYTVEVSGETRQGDTTTDVYSTAGFADALQRVKELCP